MARPRETERIDIKARAVETAARLFAERGLDHVTLRDIAEAIGCRAPALYRYFASKEALLLAVHDEGFRRLYAATLDAAQQTHGASALERLRGDMQAYVRFALDNPQLYELMFSHPGPHHRLAERPGSDHALHCLEFLEQLVAACKAEGYLPGLAPEIAAYTLWAALHGAVSLALRHRAPFQGADLDTMVAAALDTVMALVEASHRPA